MKEAKPLVLNVKHKWFELMVTGEKKCEYRKPSPWIRSRLWKRKKSISGIPVFESREYIVVKIVSGYGSSRPYFIARFIDHLENIDLFRVEYSNGLKVDVDPRDIIVRIGEILKIENYNINQNQ
jgi:hypothetical protein